MYAVVIHYSHRPLKVYEGREFYGDRIPESRAVLVPMDTPSWKEIAIERVKRDFHQFELDAVPEVHLIIAGFQEMQ